MNSNDGLSFSSAIDTSDFDKGLAHIENGISQVAASVESESSRIQSLFTDIPKINLDLSSISDLDAVELGFQQVGRIIEQNRTAVAELETKYRDLKQACGEAYEAGNFDESVALSQDMRAVEQVINARKRAIREAEKYDAELVELCKQMNKEAAEAEKERQKQDKARESLEKKEKAANSLRTRIRELTMEAAALRDAAQAEGQEIDKSTGRYREIIEELGRLQDIQGDIRAAGSVFANDENQFAGVISGLTGLSGAFSAAQGAVGLFAGENEHLQEIMLKVQSLMAITMGLQQIQQTLNKDSAFSLVTLNSLKRIWNKLLGEGASAQTAETAATEASTAAQTQHATATAADAAATEADTAATEANNAATTTGTGVTAANVTATQGATAAQNAHTGAMVAGTVATKAMSVAMRVLKLALISTGIGALIVLVGELVSWITDLVTAEDDATKHTQELTEVHKEAGKTYAEEKIALEDNIKACKNFHGTKEQEKKKVDELNSKYGEALGYYDSLEQWERVLTERGPAYCKLLQLKAERQGILNKYVESYCDLLEVQHKAENGDYDAWYRTKAGDLKKRQEEIDKAKKVTDQWEAELRRQDSIIEQFQKDNNLDEIHIDPKAKTINGGKGSGKTFDPKTAAREQKKLLDEYKKAVQEYIRDTNNAISQAMIDGMEAGYYKELTTIRKQGYDRENAWKQQLLQLAQTLRDNTHAYFMTKKGATEDAWESSAEGKRSLEDWVAELLKDPTISSNYEQGLNDIHESVNRSLADVREKYMSQLIDEFGTYNQKFDKLSVEWQKKIGFISTTFPDFLPEALKQMDEAFASLKAADFKKQINWEVVFGDLENQSLQSLQYSLDKVRQYFDREKNNMSVEQIKTFQDAITSMEDEIASRNPFTAMHKSFKDISTAKDELVAALAALAESQRELNTAEQEYNDALRAKSEILDQIDNGQLAADCQELTDAHNRLAASTTALANAQQKNSQAEQRTLTARNNVTKSYKTFATNLKAAGGVVTDLGGKASRLARVFSDDVANGMDKALDFIDEVLGATSDVISAIGDVGKSVTKGMEGVVDGMSSSVQGASQATATSISTVEKASVILTVISAALQIATAIASLFNDDDAKQEEIERLQERIDQLQWELDNADAMRLQSNTANAVEKLRQCYADATTEILKLHGITGQSLNAWTSWWGRVVYSSEIYAKSVEKIADYWGSVKYTADKALGSKKYDESRKQLENLAQQQILLQRQINAEADKKDTDNGKIQDWRNQIAELAEEMATIINEMLEDIIGMSAGDLSSTLGDAFFEAVAAGEDAMESWHKKTNEIVADILKRMLITQYLEPKIGEIFDKYKTKWFGTDGNFKGIQSVIDSADRFASDIDKVGEDFNQIWQGLSGSLGKWFEEDSERSGTERGIATASQDSVDENNARLTTIQGHTYTLVQGVNELNSVGNQILEKVAGIEENTEKTKDEVTEMRKDVKTLKDAVDDITTHGIRLKN